MTPEERKMLEEVRDLARENAEMLKSIQRTGRVNTFLKVLYWAVIIAATFGAFYVLQPYVDALKATLESLGAAKIL
jgi:hypothetical protein